MAPNASQERQAAQTLRGAYRNLISKARNEKHNLVSTDQNKLAELVKEANALHHTVEKPRESAVDSELFAIVTESGVEFVRKLTSGARQARTPDDLLRRLRSRYVTRLDQQAAAEMQPSAFKWFMFGQDVAGMFAPCPTIKHMLGPLEAQPRVKRTLAHRRVQIGEVVRPEEIDDGADSEARETDQQMTDMWTLLKSSSGRVPLIELVLNHDSFAETVENLFTLSFLVRDRRVSLEKDERQGIMVIPCLGRGSRPGDASERVQFVMDYSMAQWEQWKQVVPASACLSRTRAYQRPCSGAERPQGGTGLASAPPEDTPRGQRGALPVAADARLRPSPLTPVGERAGGGEGSETHSGSTSSARSTRPARSQSRSAAKSGPGAPTPGRSVRSRLQA
ncbi:hypothetical protein ACKKBG_A07300 [Auxenochlorella protothecoides x Auxenochlorella symbiontica]